MPISKFFYIILGKQVDNPNILCFFILSKKLRILGIFSQNFENPKPRFPEGKIPEPEKTRSQKPDLDPDPEMSTPNPPRPRLLLPDYITSLQSCILHPIIIN